MPLADFIANNVLEILGTTASVGGAGLTIYFSSRANNAANAAQLASTETKNQVGRISVLAELNNLNFMVEEIRKRLDGENWELISDRCSAIRTVLSPIIANNEDFFSNDTFGLLIELQVQVKSLEVRADKKHFGNKVIIDLAKVRTILSDQKETLMIALSEVTGKLGEANGQ